MNFGWAAGAAALVLAAAPTGQQGGDEPLTVAAIRFYRPASATTTIEGVCEVRLPVLLPGAGQGGRYRFEVSVLDTAGLELQRSDWMRDVPAVARTRGATVVESFSFSAAPGRYRVRLKVTPSSGPAVERELTVDAFRIAPAMSDLLLATAVRQPASDSEPLAPGEIRRAGLVMSTAPAPRLTPTAAALIWYAELYPRTGGAATGQFHAEVLAADNHLVVRTPDRPVAVDVSGGLTRGSLDLAGLPEGQYRFRMTWSLGDTTLVNDAPFLMSALASGTAVTSAAEVAAGGDMFDQAGEARLDSLFDPLIYLAQTPRDLNLYRTLTVDGKRRFLKQFWSPRDLTPATPDNPVRDEFYRSVAFTNTAFHEGGAARTPGWNSDRGRIYLKNGRPDETLDRPAASPRPFVAWKFTRDRPRWYVFMDQTGLGNYALIGTNDRREPSRQGWERILGADGSREVYQFLNKDLRELQDLNINP
jgi:GWxTD domain-containing protein